MSLLEELLCEDWSGCLGGDEGYVSILQGKLLHNCRTDWLHLGSEGRGILQANQHRSTSRKRFNGSVEADGFRRKELRKGKESQSYGSEEEQDDQHQSHDEPPKQLF